MNTNMMSLSIGSITAPTATHWHVFADATVARKPYRQRPKELVT